MSFLRKEDVPKGKFIELPPGKEPASPVIDQCWPTKEDEKPLFQGQDIQELVAPGLNPEQQAVINEAVSKLPQRQLYIVAAKMANASERAIAQELHISRLTVRREYQQAIDFLRQELA